MFDLSASQIVLLLSLLIYTSITTWTDAKKHKIYNHTTVSMFVAGWVYQIGFFGMDGLVNGLLGFAIGFGIFFALWMIGSAGGGDVKLMGGLSVWIGQMLILKVILASLIFVILGTFFVLVFGVFNKGLAQTKKDLAKPKQKPRNEEEALALKAKRRVMPFSASVALGTWCIMLITWQQWTPQ